MNKSELLLRRLKEHRLIALLSPSSVDECINAYEILNPYGITLEVALRSDQALEGISAILTKYSDALILAGTVITPHQAQSVLQAGVAGVVSADYIPSVVEICVQSDVMCVPGGLTDAGKQLAQKAELYGCSLDELRTRYLYQWIYKLFPAVAGLQRYNAIAKSLRGPFRDLTILYTGGVTSDNISELSKTDPQGIFCGSEMTKSIGDPDTMQMDIKKWINGLNPSPPTKSRSITPGKKIEKCRPRVVTFGEIMLRLSPPDHQRFIQARSFDVEFGGSEANTAVSLSNYGLESSFVSALPGNEIGQAAMNALRAYGVDTRFVLRSGNRIGLYYLERGASQRPSRVIYDRAGSAMSEIRVGQLDWEEVFEGADWFHWSGITPALSDSATEATLEALKIAKSKRITVSVDLNYRSRLWQLDKARSVMQELIQYVDICIGNEEDAESFFGIKAGRSRVASGSLETEAYEDVARQMVDRYGFQKMAITLRESLSASDNLWSAVLFNGAEYISSGKYRIHVVDRVGGGDAFSSGLIYGIISGKPDREALLFATAASCLKQTIPGDFNLVSVAEVEKLLGGNTSGRIQR